MVEAHVAALIEPAAGPPSIEQARALCLRLARSHYENFTVLSRFVPRNVRDDLAVLYAYCRTVDDLGDEAPGDRLALLDRYEAQLDAAYGGRPTHPVLVALQQTISRFDLPREPFARLIEANRIDQRVSRHEDFEGLLHYCTHSANPVGRLFLMLYGYRDEERFALSDATCTALQLANFWQDIKRDAQIGRVYLPQDEMAEYGVRDDDLLAERASDGLRRLVRFQVERTRRFFADGLPLLDRVHGRLRVDLALFSRGGLAVLDAIDRQGHDTLVHRPTVGRGKKLALFLSTLASRRWRRWL